MRRAQPYTLLVIEDDDALLDMLDAYFRADHYHMLRATTGSEGLQLAADGQPDLIVLDIYLPDIDGFEVCIRLNESHRTRHIPIIFLTERSARPDRMHGLELGVVDYITKPFDVQELRLRVRNTLHRTVALGQEHPVTGLPEGDAVRDVLSNGEATESQALVVALRGLESFRDLYGFVASDDVLRVTSLMVSNAAEEIGGEATFVGHLDEHAWVLLVPPETESTLSNRIHQREQASLEYFYPGDNRGKRAHTADRLRLDVAPVTEVALSLDDLPSLVREAFTDQPSTTA